MENAEASDPRRAPLVGALAAAGSLAKQTQSSSDLSTNVSQLPRVNSLWPKSNWAIAPRFCKVAHRAQSASSLKGCQREKPRPLCKHPERAHKALNLSAESTLDGSRRGCHIPPRCSHSVTLVADAVVSKLQRTRQAAISGSDTRMMPNRSATLARPALTHATQLIAAPVLPSVQSWQRSTENLFSTCTPC